MKFKEQLIVKLAGLLNVNLLGTAFRARGIGNSANFEKNGEYYFLREKLPSILENKKNPIVFDVGQNKGDYTKIILDIFPNALIHAFEPNKILSDHLQKRFVKNKNIKLNDFGLGEKVESKNLYVYNNDLQTGHGTVYAEVMTKLHNSDKVESRNISLDTIDKYCQNQKIHEIDFIKIDVEGNELNVLKGASALLNSIKVIQFEFNEMNIISKSFLKDFYDLLHNFKFYRITPKGLFPLNNYSSKYEIFIIQNLVAINDL